MLQKIKNKLFKKLENKLIALISSLILILIVFIFTFIYNFLYIKYLPKNNNANLSIENSFNNTASTIDLKNKYIVTKVVDGDTLHIEDKNGKGDILRVIAINTLEKNSLDKREKCLANMATEFTKNLILGKEIYIKYDETQPKRDKYNRLLAYVYTINDKGEKESVNEAIMKSGLSKVYKASPKAAEYDKYEKIMEENIKNKTGIWDENLCK